MGDIDNKTLVEALNLLSDVHWKYKDLKVLARHIRIKKIGFKDIDGELHFVEGGKNDDR